MPRNQHHILTGVLRPASDGLFILEADDGGTWRLDVGWGWRARRLAGQRVRVMGTRSEFDLLHVQGIRAI